MTEIEKPSIGNDDVFDRIDRDLIKMHVNQLKLEKRLDLIVDEQQRQKDDIGNIQSVLNSHAEYLNQCIKLKKSIENVESKLAMFLNHTYSKSQIDNFVEQNVMNVQCRIDELENKEFLKKVQFDPDNKPNPIKQLWIDVKKNLPEHEKFVLVCQKGYLPRVALFHLDLGLNDYLFLSPDCMRVQFRNITHWMPLPEAVK